MKTKTKTKPMARRKKGRPVSGWVAIDKPEGVTSTAVVAKVRRGLDAQKAGHAGTLDPLASGVLPIALGEATKTVPYLVDAQKIYEFTACWGEARETDDREGAVTERSDHRPSQEAIEAALPAFTGSIEQVPPKFSAIKVQGERAYDLARAGEQVDLAARRVRIDSFRLVDCPDADHARFEVACGKGTYIRALARDLARALGTVGHVALIRRTAVGPFTEERAIPLANWEELSDSARTSEYLMPVETALDDIPALAIGGAEAVRLKQGRPVILKPAHRAMLAAQAGTQAFGDDPGPVAVVDGEPDVSDDEYEGLVLCSHRGQPVALCRFDMHELQPTRVFNLQWKGDIDVDYNGAQTGAD
jgi:tRNA pseudouridine55 synthase